MPIWTCSFCKKDIDPDAKPKVSGVSNHKGVYICQHCVKLATDICKQELGPNWPPPKKKAEIVE